jgi:hypothetical protein
VSRCVGLFGLPLETANPLIRCASGIGTSQKKSLTGATGTRRKSLIRGQSPDVEIVEQIKCPAQDGGAAQKRAA